MPADALKKLHTAMLDTREGYELAEKDAETPALKSLFKQMIALRTKDHEAIHRALDDLGEHFEDKGSLMATVHKTMTSARAAVTGLNEHALSPFISGEEQIVEEYHAAIAEASDDTSTRNMLTVQKAELVSKIDEMKALKAAASAS